MSDPFDTLKHLDEGPARPALPASEVRRRGDRMRRRRAATQALGAALAVVTVVGGGFALGGELTDSSRPAPPPASQGPNPVDPKPEDDWRTAIPADFPLDQGFPSADFSESELTPPGPGVDVLTPLEACVHWVFPTVEPKDRLGTVFQQPEDSRPRLLTTYADDAEAHGVLTAVVQGFDACPRESFGGVPESVALTEVRETGVGDEGYVIVRTYESDGRPAIGLGQIHVVRVGNAVLLLSTSNEGGATKQDVERQVEEQTAQTQALADAMCIFSLEGCSEDPAPVEEQSSLQRALLGLDTIRDLTSELATDWGEAENRDDPTLDCQADFLATLGAKDSAYREFQGTAGSKRTVNAEAATAVLEFEDEAAAGAAFDTVNGWLRSCQDRMAGTRPVTVAHDPVFQATGFGPAAWRVVESPAPEICTECDTGWIDAQGVALVGTRVGLLSLAYTGDQMNGEDTASSPMNDGIKALANEAAGSPSPADESASTIFGPQGMAGLELGMHTWEAPAASMVRVLESGGDCEAFVVKDLPQVPRTAHGYASENLGIMAIFARAGMATAEGIALGATEEQVRAAYPAAEQGVHGWSVPVSGFPDRSYEFLFEDGKLVELILALDDQSCYG